MSDIKIEDLRIGQKVWYSAKKVQITGLNNANGMELIIIYDGTMYSNIYQKHFKHISLTPPQETKRFWLFDIRTINGSWYRHDRYLNDKGFSSSGSLFWGEGTWDQIEKIKHENEFIDVECDW